MNLTTTACLNFFAVLKFLMQLKVVFGKIDGGRGVGGKTAGKNMSRARIVEKCSVKGPAVNLNDLRFGPRSRWEVQRCDDR